METYEQKYNIALDWARKVYPHTCGKEKEDLERVFPDLKESEDERIRKLLVWQVHRNIEDETNDLAQSVYDGIKGHDPDLEESIEDWKKCLAYLEKQKDQKPAEWSEEDEKMLDTILGIILYDSKRQFCEGHQIYACWLNTLVDKFKHCVNETFNDEDEKHFNSFINDVESGIIPYTNDIDWIKTRVKSLRPQPNQEWSEEDERIMDHCIGYINASCLDANDLYKCIDWLESLHRRIKSSDNWKPSEEQMEALERAIIKMHTPNGISILAELRDDLKKL